MTKPEDARKALSEMQTLDSGARVESWYHENRSILQALLQQAAEPLPDGDVLLEKIVAALNDAARVYDRPIGTREVGLTIMSLIQAARSPKPECEAVGNEHCWKHDRPGKECQKENAKSECEAVTDVDLCLAFLKDCAMTDVISFVKWQSEKYPNGLKIVKGDSNGQG